MKLTTYSVVVFIVIISLMGNYLYEVHKYQTLKRSYNMLYEASFIGADALKECRENCHGKVTD